MAHFRISPLPSAEDKNGSVPLLPQCLRDVHNNNFALLTEEVEVKPRKDRIDVARFPVHSSLSTPTKAQHLCINSMLYIVRKFAIDEAS